MDGWNARQKEGYLNEIYNIIVKVFYIFLQILMSDIDFFVRDRNAIKQLKLKEELRIYPPRFRVEISFSPSARPDQIKIEFRGAMTDLIFDIVLTPTPASISSK